MHARGQTNENMANTVGGRRHFWVSAQHVWKLDAYDAYRAESDAGVGVAGNEANSNRLDNAGVHRAGDHEQGQRARRLLRHGAVAEEHQRLDQPRTAAAALRASARTRRGPATTTSAATSAASPPTGRTSTWTEAVSSKNETTLPWRVWKRNPTTGVWTKYAAPPNPNGDAYVQEASHPEQLGTYLTGLCISGGTIYVTNNGRLEHASTTFTVELDMGRHDGSAAGATSGKKIQVVAKHSSTLLVGGPEGIWRSANGSTWARVLDLSGLSELPE